MYVVAIAIGLFYVFAGVVALRAMRLDALMEGLLIAIEGKPQAVAGKWKSAILTAGAWLTLASGLSLTTLSPLAMPLFIANTLVQAGYLLWASRALPPADTDEAQGRASTTNAFLIYAAATLFVYSRNDILRPWPIDQQSRTTELFILGFDLLLGWASLSVPVSWFQKPGASAPAEPPQVPTEPVNLRLRPDWQHFPLWDADTGENLSQFDLGIPAELAERIRAWDDNWQETYDGDNPARGGFQTEGERKHYRDTGKLIAAELVRVWPGKLEVAEEFQ